MIFNDFDVWEQAFKEMKLNESVSFVSRGRLITEASQVEMFNKINALLNADGMECSHKWLFSLDPTELTEAEATKVNNLWKLGCDRGMIECGEAANDEEANEDEVAVAVEPIPETPAPAPAPAPAPVPAVSQTAYTVLYSAMRNGEIKTGEAYSNSINPRSAKADVVGQLERAGYSNVKILAIECGDPDECGNDCCNTYCKQADMTPVAPQVDAIPDYSEDTAAAPIALEDDKKDDEQVEEADDKSEDAEADKADDKAADDKEDDKKEDKAADDKEDKKEDKKDDKKEDAEEPDEKLKDDAEEKAEKASDKEKEDKELDASEKAALKDSYKKAFKAAMLKCKFEDLSFDDLSLEQKVDFFTALNSAWGTKADPTKFLSDKEQEQLETIVVKK